MNKAIKEWLDANVHDGQDRSGCKLDWHMFDPDELQTLVEDCVKDCFGDLSNNLKKKEE